jgi:glycosyltransferase involved in cell wall biosynthesis
VSGLGRIAVKKVVILQKYLAPYRVPVFNMLADHKEIDLTVIYYGRREERRKWKTFPDRKFNENQSRCLSIRNSYDRNLELPYALLGELQTLNPDVIICAPDFGGIAAYLHGMLFGSHYLIWSESTLLTEGKVSLFKNFIRKLIYKKAAAFLVPGKLSEDYVRLFRRDANIYYVNNSIQEELFKISNDELEHKFSEDKIILVFSGSIIPDKGIIELLESYKILLENNPEIRSNTYLKILGAGPLDIAKHCYFNVSEKGFCENPAYSEILKKSHIFVLPSYHDCNPLTVIEALFSGNILILSDKVGNFPEAVCGNGCVVPAKSVNELAYALERIVTLPRSELVRMSYASIDIARQFTVERSVDGFLAAICGTRTDKDAVS